MIPAASYLESLGNAAARSLLLAGAVGCGLWALRVRNVMAQKTAWILVLIASLAMPVVARWAAQIPWLPDKDTFVVTGRMWPSHIVPDNAPAVSISARAYISRQTDAEAQPGIAVEPVAPPARSHDLSRFPSPSIAHTISDTAPAAPTSTSTPLVKRIRDRVAWPNLANALLLLYLTVAGVLLFRICFGAWAALRLWWHAQPARLAVPSSVRVRSSRAIASPVTVAAGIVLPADYTGWDTEKLRIVLAHESSHVRQRDFILQLAAALYVALFWFNPLGWWLKRKLTDLSETISDGAAVHQAASHASYAQVLLEFAALPRPITIGVAMAHRGHLRSRIEHLLNENNFRQAFSGGRARLAAAVLLVPLALFGATAMVRVHAAAQQTPAPATAPVPASAPAQATPAPPPSPDSPARPPAAGSTIVPDGAPPMPPPPMPPPGDDNFSQGPGSSFGPGASSAQIDGAIAPYVAPDVLAQATAQAWAANAQARALLKAQMAQAMALDSKNFLRGGFGRNGFWNDGNSYAYVTGQGDNGIHYSGNWYDGSRAEIDKARNVAHGDFLWFERDGKSYVIDDPATMAQLKPMQDQMDELGKQQEALGKQQEELGKKQEELGKQMEQLKVPTPDMQKELAKLQAVQSKLSAIQGKDASQQQLGEIESELAEVQGQLGALQGQMGGREGDLGGKMGELGGQQGKLGAQQGRLGAQQGRIAREMDGKVLTIIDDSLKDGKARPVQ